MDAVLTWVMANPVKSITMLGLLVRFLNVTTAHWSDKKGLVRWCLYLLDMVDVLKLVLAATPPPVRKP